MVHMASNAALRLGLSGMGEVAMALDSRSGVGYRLSEARAGQSGHEEGRANKGEESTNRSRIGEEVMGLRRGNPSSTCVM